jgi:hypothetical protein
MSDKFRVGYVPYSKNLQHPGDRRRLATWAKSAVIELQIEKPNESEILFLSSGANLSYWIRKAKQPVVIDLVDGYLGENPIFIRDFTRNFVRSLKGRSSYSSITFSRELKKACRSAAAVVVASPEQAKDVEPYNQNVFVILDDHTELDGARILRDSKHLHGETSKLIFWEGYGYTLKHFKMIASELDLFLSQQKYQMLVVTNTSFARWGGYIGRVKTSDLFKKWLPLSHKSVEIIPWSIEKVIESASLCDFAIIPVDTEDRFANLKPENKLLSMWHLGLPTLFSNTKAYSRVANAVGLSEMCIESNEWFKALTNLELNGNSSKMQNVDDYLMKFHVRDVLVSKWQNVVDSVLGKDDKI